jgi:hypothetical protein
VPLALCACAALLVVVYLVTPYTAGGREDAPILIAANTRYVVPALVVAAVLTAWVAGESRRLRTPIELALLVGVIDGIRRDLAPARWAAGLSVLVLGALAVAFWLHRTGRLRAIVPRRRVTLALAGAGILASGSVAVAVGHEVQQRFNDDRYLGLDPTVDWLLANAPPGSRVGLVGEGVGKVVFPAFGARLDNRVEYVGPFVDEMLRPYTTPDGLLGAVRRGRYALVLVQLRGAHRPGLSVRQVGWLRDAGWAEVARGPAEVLLRAPGFASLSRPSYP